MLDPAPDMGNRWCGRTDRAKVLYLAHSKPVINSKLKQALDCLLRRSYHLSAAFLTIGSKRSAPARKSKLLRLFEGLSNGSVRRGESGGNVWEKLNFMLFQWTHGVLSSFMTRVPLTCPSNGPFPRVSGSNASLEEPMYNQLGYS